MGAFDVAVDPKVDEVKFDVAMSEPINTSHEDVPSAILGASFHAPPDFVSKKPDSKL